jgi:hypothetical protein
VREGAVGSGSGVASGSIASWNSKHRLRYLMSSFLIDCFVGYLTTLFQFQSYIASNGMKT